MLVCNGNDSPGFKGTIFLLNDESAESLQAAEPPSVSVTVPIYINTENLNKWRTDLQNNTPNFIKMVKN